jgi:hypothetical protein
MAGVDFVFKGVAEFGAAVDKMIERADKATGLAVRQAAERIKTEAGGHINTKSGKLAAGIRVEGPTKLGFAAYKAQVGPTGPYGRVHELGHRTPRSKPPYPFMRPGFESAAAGFERIFAEAWKGAL